MARQSKKLATSITVLAWLSSVGAPHHDRQPPANFEIDEAVLLASAAKSLEIEDFQVGSGGAATSFIAITPFKFRQLPRASRLYEPRCRASGGKPVAGMVVLVGDRKVAYA